MGSTQPRFTLEPVKDHYEKIITICMPVLDGRPGFAGICTQSDAD